MLDHDQMLAAWARDGFFFARGRVSAEAVHRLTEELIGHIRSHPPARHPDADFYRIGADLAVTTETDPMPGAIHAEDRVSKVFSGHTAGVGRQLACDPSLTDPVARLLQDDDIDCFQSQFILKNPGVIGQPWHQDSDYFAFNRQPQIGAIPALMAPGDVLFFHSYLMHRSTDNRANARRTAMVYHDGRAGTRARTPEIEAALAHVNRWVPARRRDGFALDMEQSPS